MKNTPKNNRKVGTSEMRSEYTFDYSKAKPNRFAPQLKGGGVAVVLEPDVASVFGSSTAVNTLLRSVISALPDRQSSTRTRPHRRKAG